MANEGPPPQLVLFPELYSFLEYEDYGYAIRLKSNAVLDSDKRRRFRLASPREGITLLDWRPGGGAGQTGLRERSCGGYQARTTGRLK